MRKSVLFAALGLLLATHALAGDQHDRSSGVAVCEKFGPQAPRDIDVKAGSNAVVFDMAPPADAMQLCNIHFHEAAEHKSADFGVYAGEGHGGYGGGYQCLMSGELGDAELAPTAQRICPGEHGDLQPGDTIEAHWVHTTCDVGPGPTLAACVSEACANPQLRVET